MKNLFTLSMVILMTFSVFAQAPQKMSYQAVIRDAGNRLVTSHAIGMRISILPGSPTGTPVYTETQTPTTNANGLVTIDIGSVTPISGIDWSVGPYYIKTETDPTGGTNYTIAGTSQILSVPYALYSETSQTSSNAVTITGTQTITGIKTFNNDLLINGLTVGKGKGRVSGNTAIGANALYSNTTGDLNTANGYDALYSNTTGTNNTANGLVALTWNTTGSYNTANGFEALGSNRTGNSNTANGKSALSSNTTGEYNTASGDSALYSNTTATANTADGYQALALNTTGWVNTATGYQSLYSNTTGAYNSAIGYGALYNNTTGSYNTANGNMVLSSNTTGSNNTAIGFQANVASGALTNATAIGSDAVVNASNKVVIGNSNVTSIGGYANWTNYSDKRLKENIIYKNDLGLNFISKLKTVSYNYKADQLKHRRDGLIAQDVAKALKDLGMQFSGLVIDDDKNKTENLSYGDFVIPLINAVQEQQKQIEAQQKQIDELKKLVGTLAQK